MFGRSNAEVAFAGGEESSEKRLRKCLENDVIDSKFGFERLRDGMEKVGFLLNMHVTEVIDEDKRLKSAVDYYFIEEDGSRFKATLCFQPYFYVLPKKGTLHEVSTFLIKKYAGVIDSIQPVVKEDLDLPNHLIGLKQKYLKLNFVCITELLKVRRDIMAAFKKPQEKSKITNYYTELMNTVKSGAEYEVQSKKNMDQFENIVDIREYDVPYHIRVSIDSKIFVGQWYTVKLRGDRQVPIITKNTDLIETPDIIVLAFDIECTKQPLKFPSSDSDQIIMISYMIDGQGYLINNREIMSQDVDDFEYTPKPEFEGHFRVFNEPNEKAVLERFFEHIADVKPHVIVTYNGDFFDWPFVEARAAAHEMDMKLEIGFSRAKDGVYSSRPVVHMDCLCWVKRDSYLPVGSHNLKAVAKAKLRYDPVELDPEDMCRLAAEEPQVLANYSVSDAVATYYLYMKYVHPFIFALCTIIPMEPDEVLRKGSGTLCETLLMVEAFHANIVFPNKQETELNKMTSDGHVLDTETYVGGHVEALESGVFRADIPCRFRLVPEAFDTLIKEVRRTMEHAVEKEEKIPLDKVLNLEEVIREIEGKLASLRDSPIRFEHPSIYHLDVGAMYPNIILTNRLQPYAVVDEEDCASCDFNSHGARCQKKMKWMWRGDFMPATRNEFQRIQQQLESEKFPPLAEGGPPRAFHQLSKEEQAAHEKKRLTEYCRKAYKKMHVTRMEERESTICQKENSFYVDTVRAFRDRRYEYKALCKVAKRQVAEALAKDDAREIKSAKNLEVLYDSLQLAHKCILNSFYGYVMRRGARWHSMEMAGIVCHTGAAIITRAREIIEQVGRPLELDTDGIWCILPRSFPESFDILTSLEKKKKVTISYPNAVLNCMVKDHFTNHVYHDLVDRENVAYVERSENSIFFEVDGPYLAMVLPASKEEGKKLKKRYAVFNFDGSLAELKGFEVKRRGELQLIKIFQSSVFEAFLKGDTLEKCYEAVARIADYWLDILYSKAQSLPDSELFELISENRSMSKRLEDYGGQKSTSISTAKRLAEFLGDQMVKDKGLSCRYIISRKPEGSPVTERAIPLAIFQAEPGRKRLYLRKWLKDSSLTDVDIRQVLDWNYYIERLNGAIQKIITIPAALQGVNNPVPRVRHPDWLHKKILEKNDVLKQRKMSEFFSAAPKAEVRKDDLPEIEDLGQRKSVFPKPPLSHSVTRKRKRTSSASFDEEELSKSWREVLGPPPALGSTKEERAAWIRFQKRKWELQDRQRRMRDGSSSKRKRRGSGAAVAGAAGPRSAATIGGFIRKAQQSILEHPWEVIQFARTNEPGVFRVWAMVDRELHQIKVNVPRIFYVNRRIPQNDSEPNAVFKRVSRTLPRSKPVYNLYEYCISEAVYQDHSQELLANISTPDVEGIYETQVSLEFRLVMQLGCVCSVEKATASRYLRDGMMDTDCFQLSQLRFRSVGDTLYLPKSADGAAPFKNIFLYHHSSVNMHKALYGLIFVASKRGFVFVLDKAKAIQIPNLHGMYTSERNAKIEKGGGESGLPPADITFEVQAMKETKDLLKAMQGTLAAYKDEKRGPSVILLQACSGSASLLSSLPNLSEFPVVPIHVKDPENLYATMEWQKVGAKIMLHHFLNAEVVLNVTLNQCRYLHVPIGNLPADGILFGADVLYGRHLMRNNFVLWCSDTELPDLGGSEADDGRLLSDCDELTGSVVNREGAYTSITVELDIESLAVNTLLQLHNVNDAEGISSSVAFDSAPQVRVEDVTSGGGFQLSAYDESAACSPAFKVLRSVVSCWIRDVSMFKNVYADHEIVHFYRWLRSSSALLHEPALRKMLHNVMKKLFVQLLAQFKRLGSVVVFASFNKVIICTKKTTLADAIDYVQFVISNIRNKELFHGIQMTVNKYWHFLLWLDNGNYAGIKGRARKGEWESAAGGGGGEGAEADESGDGGGDARPKESEFPVAMNWSLAEHLPGSARRAFDATVAVYISSAWSKLMEEIGNPRTPRRRRATDSQSLTLATPMGTSESFENHCKDLINRDLSDKLFRLSQKIHERHPLAEEESKFRFGAKARVINPALEFVKAVCKVLSLNTFALDEVARLKRNMLKLINVGEFSDAAVWSDPCPSIILSEVICRLCYSCRNVDLCKDAHVAAVDGKLTYECSACGAPYDKTEIEYFLLNMVQKNAVAYAIQDLQCKKCLEVAADNLMEYCQCAGEFKHLIPPKNFITFLKTVQGIAHSSSMPLLLDCVTCMLEMNPSIA